MIVYARLQMEECLENVSIVVVRIAPSARLIFIIAPSTPTSIFAQSNNQNMARIILASDLRNIFTVAGMFIATLLVDSDLAYQV